MTAPQPPQVAEHLLAALGADPAFRDAVLGDLAEEHAERTARDGARAAARWYRREALRAAPHLLWSALRALRGRDVAHLAGVAVSAYVLLIATTSLVLGLVLGSLVVAGVVPPDVHPRVTHPAFLVAVMIVGKLSSIAGGYIAAALHARAPMLGALALGLAWATGLRLLALLAGDAALLPAWYPVVASVGVLVGTTLGGALRAARGGVRQAERG